MKKGLSTLLYLPILLLSSCTSIKKNADAFASYRSYNHEPIEVTAKSLETMINLKSCFSLLLYTENCSSCAKAKENLKDIAKNTNYALYQIEMNGSSVAYLTSAFPTMFSINESYPSMYMFFGDKITYKSSYTEVTDKGQLKRMINAYNIESHSYIVNDLESYKSFKKEHKDYFFFTYNSSNLKMDVDDMRWIFFGTLNSNKTSVIIDEYRAESALISEISKEFELSDGDDFTIMSIINEQQKIITLNYSVASDDDINGLLNSFFDINAVNCSR